jgi:hypothetical protein
MSDRIEALASRRTHRQLELDRLIHLATPTLIDVLPSGADLNPLALLGALAWQESSFGRDGGHCRREPAYRPGGRYFTAPHMQAIYAAFGDAGASSWSSFQILYVAAWELGCDLAPWMLHDDATALTWVIRYLDRRIFQAGARSVAEIADAYNSGSHKDGVVPTEYVASFTAHYNACLDRLARGVALGP